MFQQLFHYDLDIDNEVFLQDNIKGSKNQLHAARISAGTSAGSRDGIIKKPNEDAFVVVSDNKSVFACVLDGNSSLKPIPALGKTTGARFASHFLTKAFLTSVKKYTDPRAILIDLNKQLLEAVLHFKGTNINDTHTLPGAMGTVVKLNLDNDNFDFAHVGDTFCIVYFNNHTSELITNDLNEQFDNEILTRMGEIAKEKGITPREARKTEEIDQALKQMFNERNNNPNGTGVGLINGSPSMERYIQTGILSFKGISAIILGSDGLPPPGWSPHVKMQRDLLLKELSSGGIKQLLKKKSEAENSDPDFRKFIRYKHSDDGTGVFIEFVRK